MALPSSVPSVPAHTHTAGRLFFIYFFDTNKGSYPPIMHQDRLIATDALL